MFLEVHVLCDFEAIRRFMMLFCPSFITDDKHNWSINTDDGLLRASVRPTGTDAYKIRINQLLATLNTLICRHT